MNTTRSGMFNRSNRFKRCAFCTDCHSQELATWYGIGQRCKPCADIFNAEIYKKRQEEFAESMKLKYKCDGCGEMSRLETCEDCCDHEFDPSEGGYCLNCDKHASEV